MDTTDLILKLYQHYLDYIQGHTQSFCDISNDCRQAVNAIIQLQQLVENGQSAIGTNAQLTARIIQLTAERDVAIRDVREMALKSEDTCSYWKHDSPCIGNDCKGYIEGIGSIDEKGNYYNTKWTCMDFNYGACPMLKNTPCSGCAQNNWKNFEWRGIKEGGC